MQNLPLRRLATLSRASAFPLLVVATACDTAPVMEPVPLEIPAPAAAVLAADAPVIDPVVGHFAVYAGDVGEAPVVNSLSSSPLVDLSEVAQSDFTTTEMEVVVSPEGATQSITVRDSMKVRDGGNQSSVSFAIQFDVLEEVNYEITGGTDVLFLSAASPVQVTQSYQFNKLSGGFQVLAFGGDNTLTTSDVSFSIDGINEGTIGGGTPSQGSLTGTLQPGRYGFDANGSTFGRDGGFHSQGAAQFTITLTATAPRGPEAKQDCFKGGWEAFGFRNQGQCVRYVETGKDSR